MARAASAELKQLIVRWHHVDGKSVGEIVELSGYSRSFVYRVLSCWRLYRCVDNPLAYKSGRPSTLTQENIADLLAYIDRHPTVYLDELQAVVFDEWEADMSLSQLSELLQKEEYSRKKVSQIALQRTQESRINYKINIADELADWMIFLDESAVDSRVAQRTHGYTPVGARCVQRTALVRGKRLSILPALSLRGIIALDIFEGSVDRARFIDFLREQLVPILRPYPGPNSVVIMDNCAIHHGDEIREIIEDECLAKLIYLPPYSPDLNPIEEAFSAIKAFLRRHQDELVTNADLPALILRAMEYITEEMAEGWFSDCGYI